MPHLLLVEDCSELAQCTLAVLSRKHSVEVAPTLNLAKQLLQKNSFDLILLDVSLPDGNGFDFPEWIQQELKLEIPIIFLTGEVDLSSRLKGLNLGAVDYVTKPYYSEELQIRVDMHLKKFPPKPGVFTCGNLKFEWKQQKVFSIQNQHETAFDLTPNEYKILSFLCTHAGTTKSREEIIENVWGPGFKISNKVINTHISNLRKKLSSTESKIVTYEGAGYCFNVKIQKAS